MQNTIVNNIATVCARARCFICNLHMKHRTSFGEATCLWRLQSVWIFRGHTVCFLCCKNKSWSAPRCIPPIYFDPSQGVCLPQRTFRGEGKRGGSAGSIPHAAIALLRKWACCCWVRRAAWYPLHLRRLARLRRVSLKLLPPRVGLSLGLCLPLPAYSTDFPWI